MLKTPHLGTSFKDGPSLLDKNKHNKMSVSELTNFFKLDYNTPLTCVKMNTTSNCCGTKDLKGDILSMIFMIITVNNTLSLRKSKTYPKCYNVIVNAGIESLTL